MTLANQYVFFLTVKYVLNHWPLRDVEVILHVHFSNWFYKLISWALPVKLVLGEGECNRTPWYVIIGSGNDFVLSGNKPLPESMLTQIYVTIRRHKAMME